MSENQEIYGQQLLALIRKLTEADGDVSRNERSWLRLLKQEFGQAESPDAEFDADTLRKAVEGEGESVELLQLLLMVSLADGQTTPDEWKLIKQVAAILNVDEASLETLRRETVLAVEP